MLILVVLCSFIAQARAHFLLNLNPESLGQAPYLPVSREGGEARAQDLGVRVHPEARVHVLPIGKHEG